MIAALALLAALQASAPAAQPAGAPPSDFTMALQACNDAVTAGPLDTAKLGAAGFVRPAGHAEAKLFLKSGNGASISGVDGYDAAEMCRIEGTSRLTGPELVSALTTVLKGPPTQSDPASATWKTAGRLVLLSWDDAHKVGISVMQSN